MTRMPELPWRCLKCGHPEIEYVESYRQYFTWQCMKGRAGQRHLFSTWHWKDADAH